MNKDAFEGVAQRLQEINDVVKGLDESIRSQAFTVLKPYADGATPKVSEGRQRLTPANHVEQGEDTAHIEPDIATAFLEEHVSEKPSDNAKAIAALIYSVYGNVDFSVAEVNEIAHEAGVMVPDRVDVTLGGASVDKKPLFQKRKSGVYRPTINGRKFFKEEYGVSPGTAKRSDAT